MSDGNFLSRWSRRKIDARKGNELAPEPATQTPPAIPATSDPGAAQGVPAPAEDAPLPDVSTLTPESDFTPFMKPQVDPGVRNQAMKALFKDPQFNVMDGLDVYIADYSKPDPLPEGWLERMTQVARLGAYEPPQAPSEAHAAEEPALAPPEEPKGTGHPAEIPAEKAPDSGIV